LNPRVLSWLPSVFLMLGIGATLMLVYASLVPLNYVPLTPKETYLRWKHIPWNDISLYSRSDWIANALVVIPSAFFLAGAVDCGRRSRWFLILASPLILLFLAAVVLGIELVQVWFPPRTVSQNDIFAGWCGAGIGLLVWVMTGRSIVRFIIWFREIPTIGERVRIVAQTLCVLSAFYALYPFDVITSKNEWLEKVKVERINLSLTPSCDAASINGYIVSFIKIVPFGVCLGLTLSRSDRKSTHSSNRYALCVVMVVIFAFAMEFLELPIFTNNFAITEGIAGCLGGWTGLCLAMSKKQLCVIARTKWVLYVCIIMWSFVLLFSFNWRFDAVLNNPFEIRERWKHFFELPLMKYYYTSEYKAFSNLSWKLGMFAIYGSLFLLLEACRDNEKWNGARVVYGFGWTILVGGIIECLQVYLPPMTPDATDVLWYVLGFCIGYYSSEMVVRNDADSDDSECFI